ncbi:hypothetical protein M8994_17310 [Brucella sp. 21LCYQ03]|nr:hypothetical protein [Brucella sp. 21LCYQ03]
MSSPVLDLRARAFTYERGDITLIGSWLRMGGSIRPCLVLIRSGEEYNDFTIPCVITLDKAWIWDEDNGDVTQAASMAATFIEHLRLSPDKSGFIRIASLIHDHLDDLIGMNPFPPMDRETVAFIEQINNSTGKSKLIEVKDYV